ncbi:MAG: Gfo/Idh/MocA family oxidoreductase [bacterium]|nr:Gfo/Idh/MocA family oxidoreductase [bacterium]
MPHQVAIIGCGDMGRQHAAAWLARGDARIAAVHDPDAKRCQALAGETGARPCVSVEEALEIEGVGVVSVCTPVCHHASIACAAAARGRHVLCEKPIALSLDEADRMIATARENGVQLGISYQYRGFPKHLKYRELFRSGAFGGPLFARFVDVREVRPKLAMHRVSMNGGPLIDMAGHFFDLMAFLTGGEPRRVFARGHVFGRSTARLAGIDDLAIDAAEILVDYDGGHVLSAFVNWGMIEGHPGVVREELIGPKLVARPSGTGIEARFADRTVTYDLPRTPPGPTVRIADLVAAIETGRAPEVSGAEGRRALRVSLAALESVATGRAVEL